MVRNFAIALLAAAALSIAVPNTSEAGWVTIHGRYVWINGTGSSTDENALSVSIFFSTSNAAVRAGEIFIQNY